MHNQPISIVPTATVILGNRYRKFWIAGWVAAGVFAIYGSFMCGKSVAYNDATNDLIKTRQEIEKIRKEQDHVTRSFVVAWENQQSGIRMITSWVDLIKERDLLSLTNHKNAPNEFARRK